VINVFVAAKAKNAVKVYLAQKKVEELLAKKTTQKALRDALVRAREAAEKRQQANEIAPEVISQRVSV
jgi:benzoyl-CoA reductase/2-hydroxyglutaryl-CoA dehydratase subunit BcrC/BadD/HgdB